MSVSILEALQNAECNLETIGIKNNLFGKMAMSQLHNAIVLLEKEYGIYTEVEPLLEKYGEVQNVPDFEYKNFN